MSGHRIAFLALSLAAALALAACGGNGDEEAAPTGASPPAQGAETAVAGGGTTIATDRSSVTPGTSFTVTVQGLPEDVVSGARELCVGVVDPTGEKETLKLGRVAPGEDRREVEAVLPSDMTPGAYQLSLAACDFSPGSAIATADLDVR